MANESQMKITFLGTGTSIGVPVIACDCQVCKSENPKDKRLRSSVMIEVQDKRFIIDCGPDFRYQMLRENVPDIDAIIFTHQHRDHIAGIDDVRSFNYVLNKTVNVYGTKQVVLALKTEFPYIFAETRYFGAPQLNVHTIDNKPFNIENISFMPILAMHHELPIQGYRIGNFTYITDASLIEDSEIEKIEGTELLILNALRKSRHFSHFSLQEAIDIIQKIKPKQAYLTHMSHFIGLHDEVNKDLPSNIQLAYDGLTATLDYLNQ